MHLPWISLLPVGLLCTSFMCVNFVCSRTLRFSPSKISPVILVPGDGGSQMQAYLDKPQVVHAYCSRKSDWFPIWLNLELITPLSIDCLVDNLRLVYDNKTRTTSNSPGVWIRIPGFGKTATVEYLDESQLSVTAYFHQMVEALVANGFERNMSVRGAPYDFRKAANEMTEYYSDLRDLIEMTYIMNGFTKVTLLGHSMGNIVTLYFLNNMSQKWKDKYIQSFVSIAAPWAGAVKTLRVMASGDNLGLWFLVLSSVARTEQRTMPSTAWMLPNPKYWHSDEVLVVTAEKNYTAHDYEQFFKDINYTVGWDMRQDTQNLIMDLKAPGVEVHCLHGSNVETPAQFQWSKGYFPDWQPKSTTSDGDGTVNMRSLAACTKWAGEQKQKVEHKIFPGAEHMKILFNDDVINYIIKLVMIEDPSKR